MAIRYMHMHFIERIVDDKPAYKEDQNKRIAANDFSELEGIE